MVVIAHPSMSLGTFFMGGGFTACLPGEGGGDYAVAWYEGGELRCAGASVYK